MKRTETITICNQEFTIKTSSPKRELDEIVLELEKKIKDIEEQTRIVTTQKLALYAALLTTAENYAISKKIDFLIKKISEVCN